ncbi:class I SAM-dependent methyltransferase [Caldalkalibacillus salinus]|uniref:class I SAM-dependent methyltransferase n=1 Tax=Caldalkalibacillus salinus TaxID=2803787 RepID=UPI0019249BEC|nr:SAM-dependent methyltransferase [Caldalkalibacillus salinus]
MALLNHIVSKIKQRPSQSISFYEYMQDCLYHPVYGYYMREERKIGKQGDFYTSSDVHPVYARVLADIFVQVVQQSRQPVSFVEMGAGKGTFAKQMLDALQAEYPSVYEHTQYVIIEVSGYHRRVQGELLNGHDNRVVWTTLADLSDLTQDRQVFFYSNELVDAFPVHVLEQRPDDRRYERFVGWDEGQQRLTEKWLPLERDDIHHYLDKHGFKLSEGQKIEVCPDMCQWLAEVTEAVEEGMWITVDYGYLTEEYQHPARKDGTLLCYDRHQTDDRPLERPGEKDITAHVHFEVLRDEAIERGWTELAYLPQHQFLLQAGILDQYTEQAGGDPFQNATLRKNRAIRQFVSPEGLGATFKVLILAKGAPAQQSFSFLNAFKFRL